MNIHYLNRYKKFIDFRKQNKLDTGHIHHILPRSMGGTSDDDNLVTLSIREHFIAHWLLAKGFDNGSCWAAFRIMCLRFKDCSRVTSKMYEFSEKKRIEHLTGLIVGKVWTMNEGWVDMEEFRNNRDQYQHHSSNKITVVNLATGKNERIPSDDFDPNLYKNIKDGMVNVYFRDGSSGSVAREEFHRNKHLYRCHNSGLVTAISLETGETVQISREEFKLHKNIKYKHPTAGLSLKCPFCGKEGGNSLKRWHFDNCKNKEGK